MSKDKKTNKPPTTIPIDRGLLTKKELEENIVYRGKHKYTLGGVLIPSNGRFSKFYQPQSERNWTLEKAMEMGSDLLLWMEHPDNNFFLLYLSQNQLLGWNTIAYLEGKYKPFGELMEVVKAVQEAKLVGGGLDKKLQAQVVNFVLANNHGYKEQRKVEGDMGVKVTAANKDHKDLIDDILEGDE